MTETQPKNSQQAAKALGARQLARALVSLLILIGSPFLAAGRLDWWQGWALVALTLAASVAGRIIPARRHPDLLKERAGLAEAKNVKPWDRVLMPIAGVIGPLIVWVTAGLDERLGWPPPVPLPVQLAGFAFVAAGGALATWAMAENRFFSAVVRIQNDRGHAVISSGPYRLVRHPGYAAALLVDIGTPLALGSLWALVPGVATVAVIALRTALEDRTLQAELDGYREYAGRVRYRLLPGVW